ncbi:uncharacterized protein LOC133728055 isoform X2 [Rosa rugosa]|uniref:uncharacterized protein LOC133728055 isoform X2 n=1 Tax=Rosa rugosa TaxID=74645 RepID=UPI002B40C0BA|nr:uncharacterized protein LOC133728055 isoform X2 [Rosa rugosa]
MCLSSEAAISSEKKKKGKGGSSRKANPIPDYVHVHEFVFVLSEKLVCSFEGHLDAVLDLSWSRDQLLLSSSMDKTVRLWDMVTKSCLKMFAHNDYENLILTADHKTVKLADFGLVREESLTEMMTAETGTNRWIAPKLYSTVTLRHGEKKHYNHKVDAYSSFAIVLWELIQNKLPFEDMSNLQAAYAAAFKNVRPSAEDLPEDLALIVTSCWKEDPNDRPNFSQIIQMLMHYLFTISPSKPAIPQRIFRSDNAILPPECPSTSSLMATHNETSETPKVDMEEKSKVKCQH